jgi:lipid-A-disaccharide synthase-like uncharacterized protein
MSPHSGTPPPPAPRFFPCLVLGVLLLACAAVPATGQDAGAWDTVGEPVDPARIEGPVTRFKVELRGAKDNVKLARLKDGSVVYIVKRAGSDRDRMVSPEVFARMLYAQRTSGGWINTVFNITSPAGIAWVALGLGGQLLFTGRMLVQWVTSERSRRSVIPVAFWWMSLAGATMLLVYFLWRRDIVGILGQATGWFIYVRNLVLIRRSRAGG